MEPSSLTNRIDVSSERIDSGQIILFEQYRLFRRIRWWILAAAAIVTAAVGVLYFTVIPVQYASVVRVLPPNKSGTPLDNLLGGVASTLKDFGLSRLVSKGSGASGYAPSIVFTSRALYDSLIPVFDLFTVYDIPRDRVDLVYAELESNIEMTLDDDGPVTITVYDVQPRRAAAIADSVIRFTNQIAQDLNRRETEPITFYIGRQLELKRGEKQNLEMRLSKFMARNRLFDPEGQAPAISTAIFEAEAELSARREAYEIMKQRLGEADPMTIQASVQLGLARERAARLRKGEGGIVAGPRLDSLPASSVEYAQLRLGYEALVKYLAILEPMYEQSRFDEIRNIPVFNVLDPPRVPVKKARPMRSVILASTFLGTLLLGYAIIGIAAYMRSFKRRYDAYALDVENPKLTERHGDSR